MKLAVQSPKHSAMVKLHTGAQITREFALASGYTIAKDEADAAAIRATAGELSGAGNAYLDKLLALPEAKERPLAAAKIAARHTAATMPPAKAALFLSGLPLETASEGDAPKRYAPEHEAQVKRKVELHLCGLDMKSRRGDPEAREDAMKIRYGLELSRTSSMQCAVALKAAGVDLDKLTQQMGK